MVRTEFAPVGYDTVVGPAKVDVQTPPPAAVVRKPTPPITTEQIEQPEMTVAGKRPSILQEINGPLIFEQEGWPPA